MVIHPSDDLTRRTEAGNSKAAHLHILTYSLIVAHLFNRRIKFSSCRIFAGKLICLTIYSIYSAIAWGKVLSYSTQLNRWAHAFVLYYLYIVVAGIIIVRHFYFLLFARMTFVDKISQLLR